MVCDSVQAMMEEAAVISAGRDMALCTELNASGTKDYRQQVAVPSTALNAAMNAVSTACTSTACPNDSMRTSHTLSESSAWARPQVVSLSPRVEMGDFMHVEDTIHCTPSVRDNAPLDSAHKPAGLTAWKKPGVVFIPSCGELEYGVSSQVSTEGDVYSYGIILLEMFTGRRPAEEIFKEGLNLYRFVEMALPNMITDVLDPMLYSTEEGGEDATYVVIQKSSLGRHEIECIASVLNVGLFCSKDSPKERTRMSHALNDLQRIRNALLRATNA